MSDHCFAGQASEDQPGGRVGREASIGDQVCALHLVRYALRDHKEIIDLAVAGGAARSVDDSSHFV